MYSQAADASKVALVHLAKIATSHGIDFIDCQLPTEHLSRMGAVDISRKAYLAMLEDALKNSDRTEHWHYSDQSCLFPNSVFFFRPRMNAATLRATKQPHWSLIQRSGWKPQPILN